MVFAALSPQAAYFTLPTSGQHYPFAADGASEILQPFSRYVSVVLNTKGNQQNAADFKCGATYSECEFRVIEEERAGVQARV